MGNITKSTVKNTMARFMLTQYGKIYLKQTHLDEIWNEKEWFEKLKKTFNNKCAYCDKKKPLEREHLLMMNAEQCGLHHPGNIVPCCKDCQKRKRHNKDDDPKKKGKYFSWEEQLEFECGGTSSAFFQSDSEKLLIVLLKISIQKT